MALAISVVTAFTGDATDANSYTLTAFTPTASRLLVAMLVVQGVVAVGASTFGESHLTWTRRVQVESNENNRILEIWTANVDGSPGSIQPVWARSGSAMGAPTSLLYSIWEVSGHDTANPIRQTKSAASTATANPALTFDSALLTNNAYIIGYGDNLAVNAASTPPAGWTESADNGQESSAIRNAYRVNGETGSTYTFTRSSSNWFIGGLEINVDPGVTAYPRRGIVLAG